MKRFEALECAHGNYSITLFVSFLQVRNRFGAHDLCQYTRNFYQEEIELGHLHLLADKDPFQLYQSLVIVLGVPPRDLAKFRLLLSFVVAMRKPLWVLNLSRRNA